MPIVRFDGGNDEMAIPVEGLVVIIGIDRILGMFRTMVNVIDDLTATVIFNKWFGWSILIQIKVKLCIDEHIDVLIANSIVKPAVYAISTDITFFIHCNKSHL